MKIATERTTMLTVTIAKFVFILFLTEATQSQDSRKRQLHHTDAPHHTPSPSTDPLDAWMSSTSSSRPNVLFLVVDDLRPKLGCYGDANMVTPNIDFLASKSVRFDQAFAQVALCAPSRTSFLTGRRPETTRVFDLHTYFRKVAGNFTTLPQYFKQHGYLAQSVGKIFHPGEASGDTNDYPYSWSTQPFVPDRGFNTQQNKESTIQPVNETVSGKLQDTTIADFAVDFLHTHGRDPDQPFFLAVGFHKPHLPWIFPKQYLDLYPLSHVTLAPHRHRPPGLPDVAWSSSNEIRAFHDVIALNVTDPDGYIPDYYQKKLRQAYSAATSYMDGQVGRVLHALSQNGLAHNTVVAFLGDHGWHLGDNGEWCKHTNFDMALRIPMMLYVPGVTSVGHRFQFIDVLDPNFRPDGHLRLFGPRHTSREMVEAVDLYPTLCELTGLPVPPTCPPDSQHVALCAEGASLVPIIRKVRGINTTTTSTQHPVSDFRWKDAAFSQYHRHWESKAPVLGYSIRTSAYRYTEWVHYDRVNHRANFSLVLGRELYRHDHDPYEFNNLANVTSYSNMAAELSKKLRDGWRKTLVDSIGLVY